jgi:hypothetical protein
MTDFANKLNLEIELDLKTTSEDGSTFYRFAMLDGKVIFWFSLHNNKDIYSIKVTTEELFPISGTMLYAYTNMDEPFYFENVIINPHTLNDDIITAQEYIKELQLACAIGQKIEDFFENEFLQKYVEK